MSLRAQLEALLRAHLPSDWDLIPYAKEPDVLFRPLVMVDVKSITTGPSQGVLSASAHVYVLVPNYDATEANEDAVDDSMPFVVDVLSRVNAVTTVSATRGDFLEKFPCWDIDLTLFVPITDD